MDINKVVDFINVKGIPGQGLAAIKKHLDDSVLLSVVTFIKPRTTGVAAIRKITIEVEIPLPDSDNIIDMQGQNIVLVRRARLENRLDDLGMPAVLKHVNELIIDSVEEVYAEIIGNALAVACAPIRRGTGEFNHDTFTTRLSGNLSSEIYSRNLPPHYTRAEVIAWNDTIVLPNITIDTKNPVPEGWEGVLDLTTTPQSEKVCAVYTLTKYATVVNKKLVAGSGLFSTLALSGTFAPACAPTQMYKTWTTARNFVQLANTHVPRVRHIESEPDMVHGRNLLTAIVHDNYNQMDQLTISRSAAEDFLGFVYSSVTVSVTSGGSSLLVHVGETVVPGQPLASILSSEGEEEICATRIMNASSVYDIISSRRTKNGIEGVQHKIILRSVVPMVSGDKLMPRSGCKGCVVIVEDDEMPEVRMPDGSWRRAELAVNPFPVAKRKNLSMLLEMACEEADIETITIDTNAVLLRELYDRGIGLKKEARRHGHLLECSIACGYVFWMRSNSLKKYRTYGVSKARHNFQGLCPNRGRSSGISYNPTARLLMTQAKGCVELDKYLMETNFNPNVSKLCADLYAILDNTHKGPKDEFTTE